MKLEPPKQIADHVLTATVDADRHVAWTLKCLGEVGTPQHSLYNAETGETDHTECWTKGWMSEDMWEMDALEGHTIDGPIPVAAYFNGDYMDLLPAQMPTPEHDDDCTCWPCHEHRLELHEDHLADLATTEARDQRTRNN